VFSKVGAVDLRRRPLREKGTMHCKAEWLPG